MSVIRVPELPPWPFDASRRYSWADCKRHVEFTRLELIDGRVDDLSPAPKRVHQSVVGGLYACLLEFLGGDQERVYVAPMDVFLHPEESDEETKRVVQPDVLVVLDRAKLVDEGIRGAPDFVAEVLSEGSAKKDLFEKRDLYEEAGVGEYWVVDPDSGEVFAFRRPAGTEAGAVPRGSAGFEGAVQFRRGDRVECRALPGFSWTARPPAAS